MRRENYIATEKKIVNSFSEYERDWRRMHISFCTGFISAFGERKRDCDK
jgi:hypothetical protein